MMDRKEMSPPEAIALGIFLGGMIATVIVVALCLAGLL